MLTKCCEGSPDLFTTTQLKDGRLCRGAQRVAFQLNGEPIPVTQRAKNPPTVLGTQVQSLGQKDPLEQGMATHPSILAWEIPRTEKPGGL